MALDKLVDGTSLPGTKADLRSYPSSVSTSNYTTATEFNNLVAVVSALKDRLLEFVVNAKSYGATGDGSTNDAAAVGLADTAAASNRIIYFPSGSYRIGTNTTVASPVWFAPGASVSVDNGVTLTLNGAIISPTDASVFGGSGTTSVTGATQARAAGTNNLVANWPTNTIRSDLNGSTIAGGGGLAGANPNIIGSAAGMTANVATIGGGYDNINDHLAGTIAGGAHHRLEHELGGNHGAVLGGSYHTINSSGSYNTVGAGTGHTIGGSAAQATIAGGLNNTINGTGTNAAICGGSTNTASGEASVIIGGESNTASGNAAAVLGGRSNVASKSYSSARGLEATTPIEHTHSIAAGKFTTAGDAQTFEGVLVKTTTDATATSISLAGAYLLTVPDSTTWTFSILLVGRCASTGESAGYKLEGVIERGVGVATTALVGSVTKTVLGEDVVAWDVSATADTSLGDLRVRVTGEAAKTIKWVGHVRIVSVTAA